MGNRIHDAFEPVHASAGLKDATARYLSTQRGKRLPRPSVWRRSLAAVCAALLLAVGVGGYHAVQAPVAYISVDVNPSVELALNCFDRIVSATAYNSDGAQVLDGLAIKGKPYGDAIDVLVQSDAMEPYLSSDSQLTFTVAADSDDKESLLLTGIENSAAWADYAGESYTADLDCLAEAHSHGLSFGKYAAFLVLAEYDDTVTPEDCHDMTMEDIHDQIDAHCHGHQDAGTSSSDSYVTPHSHGWSGTHHQEHGGGY